MVKHILICDDEKDILEVTGLILELEGFKVTKYSDCEEILQRVKTSMPDIILMDLWIPPNGGEAAIKEIRNDPQTKNIPIIIFSANNRIKEFAERAGADGILPKPFEIKQLESLVKNF